LNAIAEKMPQEHQPAYAELIIGHLSIVKYVVDNMRAYLPSYLDRDDIESAAKFGLVMAAQKFDPARGIRFNSYAEGRIRGAVLDSLRSMDWLSRDERKKFKETNRKRAILENQLGRTASDSEIADFAGMSIEEYRHVIEAEDATVLSIDGAAAGSGENDDEWELIETIADTNTESPHLSLEYEQDLERLTEAIETLSSRHRTVLTLYYYEELNLKEIGMVLGVTESRVSQIHSEAVEQLKLKCTRMEKRQKSYSSEEIGRLRRRLEKWFIANVAGRVN